MSKMIPQETAMNHHTGYRFEVSDMEDDRTGTATRSESGNSFEESENNYCAKAESRTVQNLKLLVLSILLCVTIAVCFEVYYVTSEGQQAAFELR